MVKLLSFDIHIMAEYQSFAPSILMIRQKAYLLMLNTHFPLYNPAYIISLKVHILPIQIYPYQYTANTSKIPQKF